MKKNTLVLFFLLSLGLIAAKVNTNPTASSTQLSKSIPAHKAYLGIPKALTQSSAPQEFNGYVPDFTKIPKKTAKYFPVQVQNIKPNETYDDIEVVSDKWITMACEEALSSAQNKGGPFGAVILQIDDASGNVIRYWREHNHVTENHDPTAHAEVSAIRAACQELGVFDLGSISKSTSKLSQPSDYSHCVIYSSCEPCPMCYSAIKWAKIPTLIFAATRYDAAVQGVNFSDEAIYLDLKKPYKDRKGIVVKQSTTGNSLDAFNYWKRSNTTSY